MLSRACVATFGAVNLVELQLLRVLWLVLPFVAGPVFEAAMDDGERSLQVGGGVLLWVVWGVLLITLMVPRTESLTVIRVGIPGALPLLFWALIAGGADAAAVFVALSTAIAAVCGSLAWRPPIGDAFVDGSSYGDERRFLLRTPGALAIGPLFVVCAVIIAGLTIGPVYLLAQRWIAGLIFVAVGFPAAWSAGKALHRLSQRWLVFVPAGVVVHDKTALREPQLFRVEDVSSFGPAPVDAADNAEDLTLGSMGLVLEAELKTTQKVILNSVGSEVETTEIDAFLVAPTRPGAVVAEALDRGFSTA